MAPSLTVTQQARMVAGLLALLRAQNPPVAVDLIETHISFVLLAVGLLLIFPKLATWLPSVN